MDKVHVLGQPKECIAPNETPKVERDYRTLVDIVVALDGISTLG
jgi:hypothetical protein